MNKFVYNNVLRDFSHKIKNANNALKIALHATKTNAYLVKIPLFCSIKNAKIPAQNNITPIKKKTHVKNVQKILKFVQKMPFNNA